MAIENSQTQVALLIDWENLKRSTNDQLGSLPDILTVRKVAARFGSLRLARVYANWTDVWHEGDPERLALVEIDPIFVQTRPALSGNVIKNSVDLRIACDGVELLTTHPGLSTFVIVSGDGDLVHLLTKLKGHGKTTVVLAVKDTLSALLRTSADHVILYDDLISGLKVGRGSPKVEEALAMFSKALAHLADSKSDCSLLSVKAEMVRHSETFDEEDLGIPTFRHLAFLAESAGKALIDTTVEPYRAYPPGVVLETLLESSCWQALISQMDVDREYPRRELEAILAGKQPGLAALEIRRIVDLAMRSGVIYARPRKIQVSGGKRSVLQHRLNVHHPRVQVVLQSN